jgi:predicted dienelactone hydrolase
MKMFVKIAAAILVLGAGLGFAATQMTPAQASTPTGETPELGRMGALPVGTQTVTFDMQGRPKITLVGAVTGRLPIETRRLSVRMWYPATTATGAMPTSYRHVVQSAGKPDFVIDTKGIAIEGAPAKSGERYPLVLMSHGYRAWASHFSNLAENLASKGYVVAAIDHEDANFDSVRSFQMSFGNVMLDRVQDQRQILTQLLARAAADQTGPTALIDGDKVGLLGYSMGGFGALATAGAPYDVTSKTIKALPAQALTAMGIGGTDIAPKIKALVTLAPWGTQPDNRSFTAADLAKITAPVLVISGDEDDVVNFDQGVSWLFDNLTGTNRHMLTYQGARHNIAGNPVPITETTDFSTLEFFTEPVWRTERLNQINQHFITAFLDLHLKGDASKAAFLDVPTQDAADSDWPSAPGEQLGGRFADAAQPKHWRGFQRRWAMGLSMQKAAKGAIGTAEVKTAP